MNKLTVALSVLVFVLMAFFAIPSARASEVCVFVEDEYGGHYECWIVEDPAPEPDPGPQV